MSNIKEDTNHSIQLKYEKSLWRIVDHQLPLRKAFDKVSTNLLDSVTRYMMLLDNLEPFYKSVQTLDEICNVGEPSIITSKTNWRLVKFSNKIFIKIEFLNPLCIEELSVTFHGCTNTVREMTETYNARSTSDFYEDESIYHKLLRIFELPYFPATDEDCIECAICLSYHCENNRCPIVRCENDKCDSFFHLGCLEKYLKVQDHIKILSLCIGECPFCKQALSNSYAPFFKNVLEVHNENDEQSMME